MNLFILISRFLTSHLPNDADSRRGAGAALSECYRFSLNLGTTEISDGVRLGKEKATIGSPPSRWHVLKLCGRVICFCKLL